MENNFHQLFLDKVKPTVKSASPTTDKEFISLMFHSRSKVRLTLIGARVAKKLDLFKTRYEVKIPPDLKITPRRLIMVVRRTEYPFFLDHQKFITFDQKIAAHLILLEGSMKLWFGSK